MNNLPDLFKKNPVFAAFALSDLNDLARLVSRRSYQRNEKVILYGDVWPYLFLVGQGSIDAVKESGEGRTLMVSTFLAGDIFWGLAFFQEDSPMPVTLEAREDTLLYLWSRVSILPILTRNGEASWELCRLMAGRMQRASEILEGLAFQPVAGDAAISRHLTLDEMAARIGSTREMVCRALYGFSDKKLIEVTRTEFVLTDRAGLSRLVERG